MGKPRQTYGDIMASTGALPGARQTRYQNRRKPDYSDYSYSDSGEPNWWDSTAAPVKSKANKANKPKKIRRDSSSSSSVGGKKEKKGLEPAAVVLEEAAPLVWTIGICIIAIINFICEIAQYGGFVSIKKNPLYGPDESTLLQLGAKYGPLILEGEQWRLLSAPFIHSGIIHIIISLIYIGGTFMLERRSGFFKTVLLYFLAATYGLILSCIFVSNLISCGLTGAATGYILFLICDLCSTWKTRTKPLIKLIVLIVAAVALFALGLSPYVDNFFHVGGLIMGVLYGLISLPNMTFGKAERICRAIIALCAFPIMSVIFMICLVIFFRKVDANINWCKWCLKVNCINTSGWCPPLDGTEQVIVS